MTDQTGLVYRLSPNGKLDTLLWNGISPNGLVLNPEETVGLLSDNGEDGSADKVLLGHVRRNDEG